MAAVFDVQGPVSELRLFYLRSFIFLLDLLDASLKENKVPFGHSHSSHLPPVLPFLRSAELFTTACKSCSPSLAPCEQVSAEHQARHPLPVSLAQMCLPQTPRGEEWVEGAAPRAFIVMVPALRRA